MRQRRFTPTVCFEKRLVEQLELRERAGLMPPGIERANLERKMRQIEIATNVNEWLNSRSLKPSS